MIRRSPRTTGDPHRKKSDRRRLAVLGAVAVWAAALGLGEGVRPAAAQPKPPEASVPERAGATGDGGPKGQGADERRPAPAASTPDFDTTGRRPDRAEVARLRGKLGDDDATMRVIVQVRMRYRTRADLPAADEAAQQRELNDLQDRAVGRVDRAQVRHVHKFRLTPAMAMEVTRRGLDALAAAPEVADVREDEGGTVGDHVASGQVIQSDFSQAIGMDGQGQAVAVIDTGVGRGHPYLTNRLVAEACFSHVVTILGTRLGDCPNGLAEQTGAGSAAPCTTHAGKCDHGTHVAGIAAGDGTGQTFNGSPVGNGVAPRSPILAVQIFQDYVCDDDSDADTLANNVCLTYKGEDLIKAMEWVYGQRSARRIAAVNLSIGGGYYTATCDGDTLKPVVDRLASAGIATVAVTHNYGWRDAMTHPGCISTTVSVGATNNNDAVADFSNAAPFMDLWAPGVGIVSAISGNTYAAKDGTSMAAPQVAGAFAAYRQYQGYSDFGGALTVQEVVNSFAVNGTNVKDTRPAIVNQPDANDNRPAGSVTKPRVDLYRALQASDIHPNSRLAQAKGISGASGTTTSFNAYTAKEVLGSRPSQVAEPDHAGNRGGASVWFRWTAPSSGRAVFTTAGSNFDTLLQAYRAGTAFGTPAAPGGDDCAGTRQSRINVPVTAGSVYNVAVDGFRGSVSPRPAHGDVKLAWQYVPANDDHALASAISGATGKVTGTNAGATSECAEPAPSAPSGVWWRYVAPATGTATFATTGSTFDTVLDVFTPTSPTTFALQASNDDDGPGLTSVARVPVTAGQPYYVRVRGYNGTTGGITLSWRAGTPMASVGDRTVSEGSGSATVPITLDGPTADTVTLRLETADGTAKAGSDYVATVREVSIEPGATEASVVVPIIDDKIRFESVEGFIVKITLSREAGVGDAIGEVAIVDNDG